MMKGKKREPSGEETGQYYGGHRQQRKKGPSGQQQGKNHRKR